MRLGDLLTILILVLIFDLAIPMMGVFITHYYWGRFRRTILHFWQSETLRYEHIGEYIEEADYRYLGSFDGVDADGMICLRNSELSILADPQKTDLFLIPEGEGLLRPEKVDIQELVDLGDVVKIFAGGPVCAKNGRLFLCTRDKRRPVILLYTGSDSLMFARSVTAGHRVHPYLNKLTPFSLGLGTFLLLLLALGYTQEPSLFQSSRAALSAALIPVYPLLPPGILTSFVYITLSRKAHRLRLSAEEVIESHEGLLTKTRELDEYRKLNRSASVLQISGVGILLAGVLANAFVYFKLMGMIRM